MKCLSMLLLQGTLITILLYLLYLKSTTRQVANKSTKIVLLLAEVYILTIRDLISNTDVIMDMLGNPKLRQIITESYQNSYEPILVRNGITEETQRYVH